MKYVHELEGDEIIVSGLDLRYFKSGKKTSIKNKTSRLAKLCTWI
jgi:hypothetical protein